MWVLVKKFRARVLHFWGALSEWSSRNGDVEWLSSLVWWEASSLRRATSWLQTRGIDPFLRLSLSRSLGQSRLMLQMMVRVPPSIFLLSCWRFTKSFKQLALKIVLQIFVTVNFPSQGEKSCHESRPMRARSSCRWAMSEASRAADRQGIRRLGWGALERWKSDEWEMMGASWRDF